MEQRDAKRAKRAILSQLGRSAYVSKSGMETLLSEMKALPPEEVPDAFSRRTINRACDEAAFLQTPHGPIFEDLEVRLSDGELVTLHYLSPLPLLHNLLQECAGFANLFAASLRKYPPSRERMWRVVAYSDEVVPGNALRPLNERKLQAIYWSFMELQDLSNEHLWLPLAFARSTTISSLEGGMSYFFSKLLLGFFGEQLNLQRDGVAIRLLDAHHLLFARLATKIADESALRQIWCCRGSAGSLPCMLCSNVVFHGAGLHSADASGSLVPSTTLDTAAFCFHSDESIRSIVRKLCAAKASTGPGAFKQLQQQAGFTHSPGSILLDPAMNAYVHPAQATMFDWMHVYFVSGIFNATVGLLMKEIQGVASYAELDQFLRCWRFPKRLDHAAGGTDVACAKRARSSLKDVTFKCSASEGLSVYKLVLMWLVAAVIPSGCAPKACQCYVFLCEVVDLLRATQRRDHSVQPRQLLEAIVRHLRSFQSAFGVEGWTPKFHMALHLPFMLQSHEHLLSCFVHERKHRLVKRFSSAMCTLKGFEKAVLREVFLTQREALRSPEAFAEASQLRAAKGGLLQTLRSLLPESKDFAVAASAWIGTGGRCSKGDVVALRGGSVGQVWLHVFADGVLSSIVSVWERVSENKYKVQEDLFIVSPADIQEALVYSRSSDVVTVLFL
jgi:hypothetical protein